MNPEKERSPTAIVNVMTGISTLYYLAFTISILILPLYLVELRVSKVELGLVMATSSLATLLFRIPLGIAAEEIGRLRMLIAATSIGFISLILLVAAPTLTWIYPARLVWGISWASFGPLALAIIMSITPANRSGEIIGRYQTSIGTATMLGPMISSVLLQVFNYREILISASLLSALATAALIIGRKMRLLNVEDPQPSRNKRPHFNAQKIRTILSRRNFQIIALARLCFSIALNIQNTLFAIYAVTVLNISPSLVALILGIRGVTNTLTRIPAGMIGDRIGRKRPILFGYSTMFLAFIVVSESHNPYILALVLAVFGLGWGVRVVSEWTIIREETQPEIRGLTNATLFTFFDIGGILGSTLAGIGAENLPIPTVFKIASLILLVGLITTTRLKLTKTPINPNPQEEN